jgi:hypothetical protein
LRTTSESDHLRIRGSSDSKEEQWKNIIERDRIVSARFDKAVSKILTQDQTMRIRQLKLQVNGPRGLIYSDSVRALALTDSQQRAIRDIAMAQQHTFDSNEVAIKQSDKDMAAAIKVLTDDQKAAWNKLIGKRLPTADLLNGMYVSIQPLPERVVPSDYVSPSSWRAIPIPIEPGYEPKQRP